MNSFLDDWLSRVSEDPLEPDLPICDAHHHLWDRPTGRYLVDDFLADASGHNIVSSVFVECMTGYRENGRESMKPVGETTYVDALAEEYAQNGGGTVECAAAIIGYADLRLGDAVMPVLEAHCEASPKRFRGTRHNVGWDASPVVPTSHTKPTPGQLLDPTFRKGIACLRQFGLLYEVYLYHTQLLELADLARSLPDQRIIVNHMGGPLGCGPYANSQSEVMTIWQQGIAELAACPNTILKLGGIAMPRNGFGWHERTAPPTSLELADAYSPYYHYCIEQFGPSHCMFESNFPVEKQSCSYTVLWNAFKRITAPFSESEKTDMFLDVARWVYRI